jgi:hypothetical protein
MTVIAHMPDGAAGNGTTDDTSALQACFNACPNGGQIIIPDGVFRVTNTIRIPHPCMVWCSPGAHIKGDFAGTQAVIHGYWDSAGYPGSGTNWIFFDGMHWQGGTISRQQRNGPCLRGSTWIEASISDLKTVRGSPHIRLDAPSVKTNPLWGALVRVVNCRGYDGGPLGIEIGQGPRYQPGLAAGLASGQMNGEQLDHCFFEGNSAVGSIGAKLMNGGGMFINGCVFRNYEKGMTLADSAHVVILTANRFVNVTGQLFSGNYSADSSLIYHPRSWQAGRGTGRFIARDTAGAYLT